MKSLISLPPFVQGPCATSQRTSLRNAVPLSHGSVSQLHTVDWCSSASTPATSRRRRGPQLLGLQRLLRSESHTLPALSRSPARHLPCGLATSAIASAVEQAPSAAAEQVARQAVLKHQVVELFATAIQTAFPGQNVVPVITPCNNPKFGDYQCNNAMALFGALKAQATDGPPPYKSPRDVAQAILDAVPESAVVSGLSIAGPGFINARVAPERLTAGVLAIARAGGDLSAWAPPLPEGRARAVVDFSSPNIAKEMHVGHLRSTIIGDTICRTLEFAGAEVLRLNHVGDWGTQFGMLIEHLREQPPEASSNISDLQALYKAAKVKFDEDAAFKERAQAAVVKLQGGDAESVATWQRICEVSRQEFNALYERLGVQLQERGESFYNDRIPPVLEALQESQVAIRNEGALCVFPVGEGGEADLEKTPLIVQKSDGGFNYASTDLAALQQRLVEERADWVIYVTDVGQGKHFQQVFDAADRLGWLRPNDQGVAPRVDHVGFGLVMGEDGKRFRTRSGEVVRLVDLLDRATAIVQEQLEERGRAAELPAEELAELAEALGYGAVKYADLSSNRLSNYVFSYDRMLDLKGNTAVYLLYAHARIASIVRKSGKNVEDLVQPELGGISLEAAEEVQLALMLAQFPEAVEGVLKELAPSRLCEYLYDLSTKYNEFYAKCKVVGSENERSRIILCEATAAVMRTCFNILGIKPVYRV